MASPLFAGFPSVFPSADLFSGAPVVTDEFDLQLPAIPTHNPTHTYNAVDNEQFAMESPFSSNSSEGLSDEDSHHNTPRSPQRQLKQAQQQLQQQQQLMQQQQQQQQQQAALAAAQAAALEQQRQQVQAAQAHAVQLQLFNLVQAQQQQHQDQQQQMLAQHQQQLLLQQQQQQHAHSTVVSQLFGSAQQTLQDANALLAGNSAATAALASMIPQDQQSQFTAFVESVKLQQQQQESSKQLKVEDSSVPAKKRSKTVESSKAAKSKKSSKTGPQTSNSKASSGLPSAVPSVAATGNKWEGLMPYLVNGSETNDANRQIIKVKRNANAMQTQSNTSLSSSVSSSPTVSASAATSDMPPLSYGSSSASSDEFEAEELGGDGDDGEGEVEGEEEDADAKRRRLARKAELARMSRKRKKTRMGDLEAEVDRLQKEIATLRKQLASSANNPVPASVSSCSSSSMVTDKIAVPMSISSSAMKVEQNEESEHEVKKVYDAIQHVIAAHKHAEEVNQQANLHHLAKKAKREEAGQSDDADEEEEDEVSAAVRQQQESANKNVLSAMDFLVHLHTRSVDLGASHLMSIRPHLVPILPLHFLHWLMSQADTFYDDPQSLWSSLFLHELKLNHQQMKDLNALRTTVRKQGKLLTDIEKGYRKLQTALKKQFTQRVENLEKIRSILDTSQLAKFLQWVQQYGPLCLKVQQSQASIQPAQAQAQLQAHVQAQAQAQARARAQEQQAQLQMIQMQAQVQAQSQPQTHQDHNLFSALQMHMQSTAPNSFLLNLGGH